MRSFAVLTRMGIVLVISIMLLALVMGVYPERAAAADDAAAFGLQPTMYDPQIPESQSYFVFNSTPGAVVTSEVRIVNAGKGAGTARLYAVDAATSDTTGTAFRSASDPRGDVGIWLALAPGNEEVSLAPGESRIVPFTVHVPKDAGPGQHLGGIVAENATLSSATEGGNVSVSIRSRSIIAVQLNLPGQKVEKLNATGVSVDGLGGTQKVVVALANEGNYFVKPTGTLAVRNRATHMVVQSWDLKMDTFLPATAIHYPSNVHDTALDVGDYEAALDLTFGDHGELHYIGQFSISPQQLTQIFSTSAPLAAPASLANNARATTTAAAQIARSGNATAGSIFGTNGTPIWVWGVAGGCGIVFLVVMVAGAFALGRRGKP